MRFVEAKRNLFMCKDLNDINDDFVLKKCFISLGIPNDFVNLRFSNEIQKYDFEVIFGTKIEPIPGQAKN